MTTSLRATLISLAGLPGTGKSTLARALAAELRVPVLDKDRVRVALFGPEHTDYSREQDDACMAAIYAEVGALCAAAAAGGSTGVVRGTFGVSPPRVAAIIDGRTFSRAESVHALIEAAARAGAELLVVECRCPDAVTEERLQGDAERGAHPAANRDVALYRRLKASADPIAESLASASRAKHLVVDTDREDLASMVSRVRDAIAR